MVTLQFDVSPRRLRYPQSVAVVGPMAEAQVIKYLMRWRKKNGMQDLLKAQHYLEKLIEVETAKGTK